MSNAQRKISISVENYPLARRFAIARGSKIAAEPVCVAISQNGATGRGEAIPYRRYGESVETVSAAIEKLIPALQEGMTRAQLSDALLPGAARAALDCALWDLEAKQSGRPVWQLAGLSQPQNLTTALTLVLDDADKMARAASQAAAYPLLKIKLGGRDGMAGDILRLIAIREARPDAQLIVDVNEGWHPADLGRHADRLAGFGVTFFEQPLAVGKDEILTEISLPFCADESIHDRHDFDALSPAYDWVNLKIDKTGGLSEALACIEIARAQNKKIMVGCMIATSLAMAPAFLLAQQADLADLDGPLWLAKDRTHGMVFDTATLHPPSAALWG